MHDKIRDFSLEGEIGDQNRVQNRDRIIETLEGIMRDYGYVPSLDNDPQFTLDFQPDTETFLFRATVYGVKVGKDDSWQVAGVMSGKQIPKYTPQPKLKQ